MMGHIDEASFSVKAEEREAIERPFWKNPQQFPTRLSPDPKVLGFREPGTGNHFGFSVSCRWSNRRR